MAVAEASLSISIDTMSLGLMVDRGETVDTLPLPSASPSPKEEPLAPLPCIITPSITYSGSALALMVACPRTRMLDDVPGAPDVLMAVTPAARPCKVWSKDVTIEPRSFFSSIVTDAPDTSLFFITPYPTTTTSFSVLLSSLNTMFNGPCPLAFTSLGVYPMYDISKVAPCGASREKLPSMSVTVALVVPFTLTVAPIIDSRPSVTRPVILRVCCAAGATLFVMSANTLVECPNIVSVRHAASNVTLL